MAMSVVKLGTPGSSCTCTSVQRSSAAAAAAASDHHSKIKGTSMPSDLSPELRIHSEKRHRMASTTVTAMCTADVYAGDSVSGMAVQKNAKTYK